MIHPVTTDDVESVVYSMNPIIDANFIYDGGTAAMDSSKFKYNTQKFEIRHLLETALLRDDLINGRYHPQPGDKFWISERGKTRCITSNTMRDKAVNHVLCDQIVIPAIKPYLIYDNGASQKGKGVSFARKRFESHLHNYYREHGTNEGYVLLTDFSGYYANIRHDRCKEILNGFVLPTIADDEQGIIRCLVEHLIDEIFRSFELDVSYLSDEKINELYHSKVNPMMNDGVDKSLLTGEKTLKKGVDIGNQLSQAVGIVFAYLVDNYVKIVCGQKYYGRYTDDGHLINRSKEVLLEVLDGIRKIADFLGLILNEGKTRICKLSHFFRYLQIGYTLTDTGRLIRKINPKSVTRERKKLKAYKRLLSDHRIDYETVENSFKSWLGGNWKNMSHQQIYGMNSLYKELFGKEVRWKKGHSRLHWLMEHSCTT